MKPLLSHYFIRIITGLACISMLSFGAVGQASAASIIYVKRTASGANNGTSWVNAYKNLQSALAVAVSGEQIWVAKGTYKPTASTDRTKTFTLKNGVAVYGGFVGTETLLTQRKPTVNLTVLSGDIGVAGVATDNSYSVVSASNLNKTAILDGFQIVDGQADCGCFPGDAGGGVFNWVSNTTYRNLTISNNYTAGYGGGMYNTSSNPILTNVTFSGNSSDSYGGGMYNTSSSPTLTNVTFSGNKATFFGIGGGMYNDGSSPSLTNVVFSANTSVNAGGGMYDKNSSNPALVNVTFSGNTASTYGGGIYNDTSNPSITNAIFQSNSASNGGGGIYNTAASPSLTNVTFSGNSGAYGGAIENYVGSNPVIKNVTFYSNSGSNGGAVYNYGSSPALTNTTFSHNSASLAGPAMYTDFSGSPALYDSIFWGDNGGEISNAISGMTVNDSLVAGGCPAGSTCTNVNDSDPVLQPLQANGGFSRTMALGAGSAAIDTGNIVTCAPTDQRGVLRPKGGGCDIGAFEVKALVFRSVAAYDGWVLETAKASNLGGSLNSTATTLRVGDDAADRRYRTILSFDTSPLPDTAMIVMAILRVRTQSRVGNPFNSQGSLMTDIATYYGAGLPLAASDWQAAGIASAVGGFNPDGNTYWSSLNSIGRADIQKTATTQFRLRFSSEIYDATAEYLSLFSGNYSVAGARPYLVVYYTP